MDSAPRRPVELGCSEGPTRSRAGTQPAEGRCGRAPIFDPSVRERKGQVIDVTKDIARRSLTRRSSARALAALFVVAAVTSLLPATATAAALPGKRFGPGIDPVPIYQGQTRCDPQVKPGVAAFRRMVMRAFPNTGAGYVTRSCSVGGQSEHKDGRAWDWMVSANNRSDRKKAGKVFDWLLRRDSRGNRFANARRVGLMYMIFNRRMWSAWDGGWEPYSGSSPHTDHVHFSFGWPGARKQTTFWNRRSSFVVGAASHPTAQGLWAVTGNSHVLTAGASSFHGDRSNSFGGGSAVGIAPTPNGDGYWLAKKSGKVLRFGGAPRRGSYRGEGMVVDIESTPNGNGYWIVTKSGRVKAFGNAEHFGNVSANVRITGLAATPSGDGYWIASGRGRVFEFGNARPLGELEDSNAITVDIEAAPEQGYWLVSRRGRVSSFGAAAFLGDLRDRDPRWSLVSLAATPSGGGYWLVDEGGRVHEFGNASSSRARHATTAWRAPMTSPTDTLDPDAARRQEIPADPAPDEHLFVQDFLDSR